MELTLILIKFTLLKNIANLAALSTIDYSKKPVTLIKAGNNEPSNLTVVPVQKLATDK